MTDSKDTPIVAAVREARRQLAEECGGDFQKLLEFLKKEERASGRPTGTVRRRRTKP
jgi:hypothetical protein